MLDAAGRCFVDKGYAGTTMRDVADAAGVSVQTVFGQGSKASLLLALRRPGRGRGRRAGAAAGRVRGWCG